MGKSSRILKPIIRRVVKGSSLHQEESYEEFKQASYDVQKKFKFALPQIRGFEFRDEQLDGFHISVGKEKGTEPDKAIVYFPGGGSRRWQLPYHGSMKNYIRQTGAELWIPLYPLLPDYEKSFLRCGVKDYEIKIKEGMLHDWPVFIFTKEGREGEREIISDINAFFRRENIDGNA